MNAHKLWSSFVFSFVVVCCYGWKWTQLEKIRLNFSNSLSVLSLNLY